MIGRWGLLSSKCLLQLPESQPLSNPGHSFVETNLRTFPLGPAADMYIITYKNRILNKPKKTYWCLLQVCSRYENIKHCTAIGLLYLSNQKKTAKFAVQIVEVYSHLRLRKCKKLPQIPYRKPADLQTTCCYFAKFAVPSTAEKPFNCSARE